MSDLAARLVHEADVDSAGYGPGRSCEWDELSVEQQERYRSMALAAVSPVLDAVARAIHRSNTVTLSWEDLTDDARNDMRAHARAALGVIGVQV